MGEKYSKEEHDKCKKVAEAFREYPLSAGRIFLFSDTIVFEHSPKMHSSKLVIAHVIKDADKQKVLPDLTAPSQIIPS